MTYTSPKSFDSSLSSCEIVASSGNSGVNETFAFENLDSEDQISLSTSISNEIKMRDPQPIANTAIESVEHRNETPNIDRLGPRKTRARDSIYTSEDISDEDPPGLSATFEDESDRFKKRRTSDSSYTPGPDDALGDSEDEFLVRITKDGLSSAKKRRVRDPTFVPTRDGDAVEEDEDLPPGLFRDGMMTKKKRVIDPTYIPGREDDDEDYDNELMSRVTKDGDGRKKRRTLDPAFTFTKDAHETNSYISPKSPAVGKSRTPVRRTPQKRKAALDVERVTSPSPSKKLSARAAKKKKVDAKSHQTAPLSPAPSDSLSGDVRLETATMKASESVNAGLQPSHPLVLKEKSILSTTADERDKTLFAVASGYQDSQTTHPTVLAGNSKDEVSSPSKIASARKKMKTEEATSRIFDLPAHASNVPEIQKEESTDLIEDLTIEKAKRWATAINVPKDLWSQGEKDLFLKIAMRGFEPLLPKQWHYDFSTLPDPLFTISRETTASMITPIRGSEFYAIKSLSDLFTLGGYVRDCSLLGISPELVIKRAIKRYIRWAVDDAGLCIGSDAVPVHVICARKIGESTVKTVMKANRRLQKLANRFQNSLSPTMTAKNHAAPAKQVRKYARPIPMSLTFPVLVGFVISGPVVAILTLNSDPSAAKAQGGKADSNFICQFDLGEYGQDVWHSLAVAITVMHIRNTMFELASNNSAGCSMAIADAHPNLDRDL